MTLFTKILSPLPHVLGFLVMILPYHDTGIPANVWGYIWILYLVYITLAAVGWNVHLSKRDLVIEDARIMRQDVWNFYIARSLNLIMVGFLVFKGHFLAAPLIFFVFVSREFIWHYVGKVVEE